MKPLVLLSLFTLLTASVTPASAEAPEGWFLAGSSPEAYAIAVDKTVGHEGKSSGRLSSTKTVTGFGTMMQSIAPGEYLGKRVRFSAWVKAARVAGWAGMWMRVDGTPRTTLSFDNMGNRPIKGTKDWTQYEVVLDVPAEAQSISFGILVNGPGTVWIDEAALTVVDTSVPVTGNLPASRAPANLDFEK